MPSEYQSKVFKRERGRVRGRERRIWKRDVLIDLAIKFQG